MTTRPPTPTASSPSPGPSTFPDIYEAIRGAEPLDDPVPFRFPASVRHHYERLRRFPDGLLVLGDAVASFNPIYGQGMSVAAIEALTLRRHVESGTQPATAPLVPRPRARRRRALGHGIRRRPHLSRRPWSANPEGPAHQRLSRSAPRRRRATMTPLASAFIRVSGLVAPPHTLLRPHVVGFASCEPDGIERYPGSGSHPHSTPGDEGHEVPLRRGGPSCRACGRAPHGASWWGETGFHVAWARCVADG